jgi:hypothetical protein
MSTRFMTGKVPDSKPIDGTVLIIDAEEKKDNLANKINSRNYDFLK